MTDKKKSFLFYNNYYQLIKHLSDEEIGKLFRCVFQRENGEIPSELSPALQGIYCYICSQSDIDKQKYVNKCNRLAENRKGKTNENKRKQMKTNENKRKQISGDNVTDNVTDNDNDNDIDIDKESENEKRAILIWNEFAHPPLPKINRFTSERKKKWSKKWKEEIGKDWDNWRMFCAKCAASDFLSGKNDRGWMASFDWAIQPTKNNILKTLEGGYDNNGGRNGQQ